jgi:hypothetical protein
MHIYFIDDFIAFMDAWGQPTCVCTYPEIYVDPQGTDEFTIAAHKFAIAERTRVCNYQCPPLPTDCKLKRK